MFHNFWNAEEATTFSAKTGEAVRCSNNPENIEKLREWSRLSYEWTKGNIYGEFKEYDHWRFCGWDLAHDSDETNVRVEWTVLVFFA